MLTICAGLLRDGELTGSETRETRDLSIANLIGALTTEPLCHQIRLICSNVVSFHRAT